MRGLSGRSDSGNFSARVMYEANATRTRGKSAGEKLARTIANGLDSLSLDASDFAFHFTFYPVSVQRKFLVFAAEFIKTLAIRYETGLYQDDDEMLLCQDAKALHSVTQTLLY